MYSAVHDGMEAPPVLRKLLKVAAAVVVRMRGGDAGGLTRSCSGLCLDERDVAVPVEGKAREFLWGVKRANIPATVEDGKSFVGNVVVACLGSAVNGKMEKVIEKKAKEIEEAVAGGAEGADFPDSADSAFEACLGLAGNVRSAIQEIKEEGADGDEEQQVQNLAAVYEHLAAAMERIAAMKKTVVSEPSDTDMLEEEDEEDEPVQMCSSGVIKINTISENVKNLSTQVAEIKKNADLLDLSELTADPIQGVKTVDRMQKKCREYSEYLMRDLLALDAVEGREDVRPIRKAQVAKVQTLMDSMDQISAKLRDILVQLQQEEGYIKYCEERDAADQIRLAKEDEERQAAAEARRKEQEAKEAREAAAVEHKKQAGVAAIEKMIYDALDWSSVPLKPKWHVDEARNAFVITGAIPGLKTEDISIDLSGDKRALILSSFRSPTPAEFHSMFLALTRRVDPHSLVAPGGVVQRGVLQAVYRMGAGRFGAFHEEFSLPANVQTDKITANYEDNTLTVTIPKQPPPQPRARARYPCYPFGFSRGYDDEDEEDDYSRRPRGHSPFGFFF